VHFGRHRLPSCCAVVRDSRAGRVLASSRLKTPSPDSIPPFGLRRSGLGDRCGEHGSHELGTVRAVGLVTHMTPPAPCLAQPSSTVREHGLRPRVGRTHSLAPSDSRHDQACNASGAWREGEQRGAASLPCLPSTVLPSTIALEATWWHRASPCIAAWTRIAVWTRSAVSTRGGGGAGPVGRLAGVCLPSTARRQRKPSEELRSTGLVGVRISVISANFSALGGNREHNRSTGGNRTC
jgi:hypothetical protein